jgi:hypothetical protein
MRSRAWTKCVIEFCALALGWLLAPPELRAAETANLVEMKVKLHHGRVILPARVNQSTQALSFLLDTACTICTLHPDLMDELGLPPSGHVRINGIAGEERAPTYKGVVFKMGEVSYSPFRVASVPSERSESRRRDGVLGSGFFRRFVVEIDAKAKSVRLYSPTNFTYTGPGETLSFSFRDEIPVVKAAICLPDKSWVEGDFEIDTGCDSGLCLGETFVKRHKFLDEAEVKSSEKFGVGGSVETKSGSVPVFRLGKLETAKPQTDFFVHGSPVDEPLAGHIGMGVLRQFKTIFDYSRKRVILEPQKAD